MKKVLETILMLAALSVMAAGCSEREPAEECVDIRLVSDSLIMSVGETRVLEAVTVPVGIGVEYSSSNSDVVSISADGTIMARNMGYAVVTASAGDMTAACGVRVLPPPLIGDYYYSDGTYSSVLDPDAEVIGIVFWTGDPSDYDPVLAEEHPECTHGLAVSLSDATDVCWQSAVPEDGISVGDWVSSHTDYMSIETDVLLESNLNLIIGYSNTCAIKAYNEADENAGHPVDLIEHLESFAGFVMAPALSSGWYIPSAKELTLLCYGDYDGNVWDRSEADPVVLDAVNIAMEAVTDAVAVDYGEAYWSSTEAGYSKAFEVGVRSGDVSDTRKTYSYNSVRFIIAF